MGHKMLSGENANPPMDQNPPKESRPPINLRIKFRSESVEQFIERYAVDVSRGGIFIRTKEPLAVGTQLKLDFQFQNGGALMSGEGTVVWIREFDANRSTVPPGMGVRFDKLTAESQAVLEQLLAEKAKRERGGVPGSGSGGMAVRRPSSMFSVLEPQVSVESSPVETPASGAAERGETTATATATATATTVGPGSKPSLAPLVGTAAGQPRTTSDPHAGTGAGARGFGGIGGARPSQRPTPSDESAPFDVHDEPTQIAGKLPAFLSAEREMARSIAASQAARAAPQKSAGADGSATAESAAAASESGRVGVDTASHPAAASDHKPESALSAHQPLSRDQLLPIGNVSPKVSARDTVRDHLAEEAVAAVATPDAPSAAPAAPEPSSEKADEPISSSQILPDSAPMAAAPPSSTAVAARTRAASRRSPAALVGVSVLVLGGAALFLFRFFGSQSTEVVSAPASGTVATIEPAVPAAPPTPSTAPAPAPPAATTPAAVENSNTATPPTGGTAENAAPAAAPAAAAASAETKSDDPTAASVRKAPKHKPARTAREPGGAEVAQAESRPREAAVAASPGVAAPKADGLAPPPPDTEATSHEIRVSSKPVGADVTIDGQNVGKTPYSVVISDVSAPHIIAVRKDGFEPFEQMISASSAWNKTKGAKGKPAIQVLKISAKLKQIGGVENKSNTEPPAVGGEASPAKTEVAPRSDRPLPPSDVPAGTTP